ncbi:MAG: hypothetical protein DKM50_13440 [Candidatus Margulisiibacteriota bacterium]|nr:MAG: hypothetical protein A2X43_07350 [Candidatus Margulisbacteria bacterium GWD2_39_127]PZM77282.1 MAG: hypothetical protein DKM50_13440 [Candidatus Margulisiibacteriota bacterium]HAR62921.1 hypothetical protein [Candidatus Margulisiibacteriota bacterium]HCY35901.1 hypothetical protein [Candidatus Margulisiibacteriota bacterium]
MNNFVIVLFAITTLYLSSTSRIDAYIKTLAIQGFLLFLLVFFDSGHITGPNLIFLYIETLGFKSIIIPLFLFYILRRNDIARERDPRIPHFFLMAITSIILLFGFFISFWSLEFAQNIDKALYFGISVSTIITGFLIIMTRRKIITHVIAYMVIENGIFLLSLSILKEMSFIVNLGVLLDIFVAIFLLGLFITRIHSTFERINIDSLTNLKD